MLTMLKCGLTWLSPALVSAARYWTLRVVGPLGVFVRVGVKVGPAGVLVRVGVFVTLRGVLVRVGVKVGTPGVFVREGVAVGTGVPPGALPQTREPFIYAGMVGQSV